MSKWTKHIIIFVLAFIASLTAYFEGRKDMKKKLAKELQVVYTCDTTFVHDTLRLTEFQQVETRITDTLFIPVINTIHVHDTTYITLFKEVKTYENSLFKAQISGIQPNLDWIEVYPQTQYITTTTTINQKPKHFAIGIQAGVGLSTHGISPYIGVGVSYNLFSW